MHEKNKLTSLDYTCTSSRRSLVSVHIRDSLSAEHQERRRRSQQHWHLLHEATQLNANTHNPAIYIRYIEYASGHRGRPGLDTDHETITVEHIEYADETVADQPAVVPFRD